MSMDIDGKLRKGAGMTVVKGVQSWPGEIMSHLHTSYIGHNLVVNAYDGYVVVTYLTDDGEPTYDERFELPPVGKDSRRPDDMVTLDEKTLVIMGTNELLPFTVTWEQDHAVVVFGKAVSFCGPTSIQPEFHLRCNVLLPSETGYSYRHSCGLFAGIRRGFDHGGVRAEPLLEKPHFPCNVCSVLHQVCPR